MKVHEILAEMAIPLKKAIATIEANEWQMNLHLVKILTMPESLDLPNWKRELRSWLRMISTIKLRTKGNPPIGASRVYRLLYSDRFSAKGEEVVQSIMEFVGSDYEVEIEADPIEIHQRIQSFWEAVAVRIGNGIDAAKPREASLPSVDELVQNL